MCRMQGRLGAVAMTSAGSFVAGRRHQRPVMLPRAVRQSSQEATEEVVSQSKGSGNITPLFSTSTDSSLNSTHETTHVVVVIVQQVTDVLRSLVSTDEETIIEMIEGSEEPYPMSSIHEKREKVHNMLADWDRFA